VQGTHDPILESLDVELDLSVDSLVPEVRNALEVGDECINGILAKFSNLVNSFLEVHTVMRHENRDEVVGIVATRLFDAVGEDVLKNKALSICGIWCTGWKTHVRPRDQIVRALLQGLDNGVLENLLRDVEIIGVLDQVEGGLAAAGVTTDVDERFQIGDLVCVTVLSLEVDRLEELFEGLLETVCRAGLAVLEATGPITVREEGQNH